MGAPWDTLQVFLNLKYTVMFMEPEAVGKTRLRIDARGLKPGHLQGSSKFCILLCSPGLFPQLHQLQSLSEA